MLMLAAGCGPPAKATVDGGGMDGGGPDLAGCNPPFGHSFYVSDYTQLGEGVGFDLDGDGTEDNVMGVLAAIANPKWKDSIARGRTIFLVDFLGLMGPPLPDTPAPGMAFYVGIDEDNPPDPSNNGGGMGRFLVPAEQFDVACKSTTMFETVTVVNGQITARIKKVNLVAQAVGSLEFSDVILQGRLSADHSTFNGRIGGTGTPCALSLTPSPFGSGSMLDAMVNAFGIKPDIDRDGDGLEQIKSDASGGVSECVDGNGTVIPGRDCSCDPRIIDGFSSAFDFVTSVAQIVGLTANR